jgi:rare lipoprotein A (peptidoglycan hydrolase)
MESPRLLPAGSVPRHARRARISPRRRRRTLGLVLLAGAALPATVWSTLVDAPSPVVSGSAPATVLPAAVVAPARPVGRTAARPSAGPRPPAARPAARRSGPARPAAAARRLVGYRSEKRTVETVAFTGRATWYGPGFHGRRTANGEVYDQNAMTAAHRTLPFGTRVRVCTRRRCVTVRINDRGPFGYGNVIDLSRAAARRLGTERSGVARVTGTIVRTRTVRVPVYATVAPARPGRPGARPLVPAATDARAERLGRPDPAGGAAVASAGATVVSPELTLAAENRSAALGEVVGATGAASVLLAALALPAVRYRRRRGLSFVRER